MKNPGILHALAPWCLVLLLSGCGRPAPAPSPFIEIEDEDAAPTAAMLAGAGSVYDPPGKEGLAALTATLVGLGSVPRAMVAVGPEVTSFSALLTVPGQTAPWNSWLAPTFDAAAMDRIKAQQRIFLAYDLPWGDEDRLLEAGLRLFLLEGHPAAHPPAGTLRGLEAITPQDVREFFDRYYRPGNFLGSSGGPSGSFPGETVWNQALSVFSTNFDPPPAVFPPPVVGFPEVVIVERPGMTARIGCGLTLPLDAASPDMAALLVAASVLGSRRGEAGRLREELHGRRGLTTQAWAEAGGFPDAWTRFPRPGRGGRFLMFTLQTGPVDPDTAPQVLALMTHELDRLVQEGISAADLDLHRDAVRQGLRLADPSLPFRLRGVMEDRWFDTQGYLAALDNRLENLRPEDVNAALVRHIHPEKIKIMMMTGKGPALRSALLHPPSAPVHAAAESAPSLPFPLDPARVYLVPVGQLFQSSKAPWR